MSFVLRSALVLVAALGLAGCPVFHQVPVGVVTTPGVALEAQDRTFLIREGEPFATPFWVDANHLACGPTNRDLVATDYDLALRAGARRVFVHHPAGGRPMYGVLMFCTVWEGDHTEASRLYRIEIPSIVLPETPDGGVGLVFSRARYIDEVNYPGQVSWALWVSSTPI